MPSNKELKQSIIAAAEEAGVDAPAVSGKSNDQLTVVLENLKTLPAPPPPPIPPDAESGPEVELELEAEIELSRVELKVVFPYSVAPGKSITCKKGVLADGAEMKPEYIHGGQDSLDKLVDKKYVVKA